VENVPAELYDALRQRASYIGARRLPSCSESSNFALTKQAIEDWSGSAGLSHPCCVENTIVTIRICVRRGIPAAHGYHLASSFPPSDHENGEIP